MPHLVLQYSANLDAKMSMTQACRGLADTMLSIKDEYGKPVFPIGGVRVFAYPAPYFAVSDGGKSAQNVGESGDYGFIYLNLRMGRGRSEAAQQCVGKALTATAQTIFAPLLASGRVGLTLQIDVGPEVYDAKFGNIHELFNKGS